MSKNSPIYSSLDVANAFLELAKAETDCDPSLDFHLTHLKLQRLVYFAQIISLLFTGCPIHDDSTYAWDYGPFSIELYRKIKQFGAREFTLDNMKMAEVFSQARELDDDTKKIVKEVWKRLKYTDPYQFAEMFWERVTAWKVMRMTRPYGLITYEMMIKQKC